MSLIDKIKKIRQNRIGGKKEPEKEPEKTEEPKVEKKNLREILLEKRKTKSDDGQNKQEGGEKLDIKGMVEEGKKILERRKQETEKQTELSKLSDEELVALEAYYEEKTKTEAPKTEEKTGEKTEQEPGSKKEEKPKSEKKKEDPDAVLKETLESAEKQLSQLAQKKEQENQESQNKRLANLCRQAKIGDDYHELVMKAFNGSITDLSDNQVLSGLQELRQKYPALGATRNLPPKIAGGVTNYKTEKDYSRMTMEQKTQEFINELTQ